MPIEVVAWKRFANGFNRKSKVSSINRVVFSALSRFQARLSKKSPKSGQILSRFRRTVEATRPHRQQSLYVSRKEASHLQIKVREHEPEVALYGDDDGLAAFGSLVPAAERLLRPGGYLIAEMGYGMEDSTISSPTSPHSTAASPRGTTSIGTMRFVPSPLFTIFTATVT
jgi:hypothetical protein